MFGDIEVPAHVVDDSQILCTVPEMLYGIYSVTLKTNGQQYVITGSEFVYRQQTGLDSIFPTNGPAFKGSTVVTLYGNNFPNTVDLECVFGYVRVPAVWIDENTVKCRGPPHRPGRASA